MNLLLAGGGMAFNCSRSLFISAFCSARCSALACSVAGEGREVPWQPARHTARGKRRAARRTFTHTRISTGVAGSRWMFRETSSICYPLEPACSTPTVPAAPEPSPRPGLPLGFRSARPGGPDPAGETPPKPGSLTSAYALELAPCSHRCPPRESAATCP